VGALSWTCQCALRSSGVSECQWVSWPPRLLPSGLHSWTCTSPPTAQSAQQVGRTTPSAATRVITAGLESLAPEARCKCGALVLDVDNVLSTRWSTARGTGSHALAASDTTGSAGMTLVEEMLIKHTECASAPLVYVPLIVQGEAGCSYEKYQGDYS
jgi:hypothetical protein